MVSFLVFSDFDTPDLITKYFKLYSQMATKRIDPELSQQNFPISQLYLIVSTIPVILRSYILIMFSFVLIPKISLSGIHYPATKSGFTFLSLFSDLNALFYRISQILKDSLLTVNIMLLSFHVIESIVLSWPDFMSLSLVRPLNSSKLQIRRKF